ncbi:hypothetical protein L6164_023875 [Bauhinia variegata]|uniref:Uncharacterized protein n=1 Tax=Bauhinia variegata TaxID=167791 RepID=A0ACB9MLU5_BAUVA|nr:hypothetical protein L6164_023875 [Bauhinia variegata]
MGLSLSAGNGVRKSLSKSPEFNSACESAFNYCRSLTQDAFQGVLLYQLNTASQHLHHLLSISQSESHPVILIHKWVSTPPSRSQVDSALRRLNINASSSSSSSDTTTTLLGPIQFKDWAVELYTDAVVSAATKALMLRVPVGVAGIAGLGAATRFRKEFVATAVGAYSLGVVVSIFLGLSR